MVWVCPRWRVGTLWCALAFVLAAGAISQASTTITLQDGTSPGLGRPTYWGTSDAFLDAHHENWNAGGLATVRVRYDDGWSDPTCIKFDLTGQVPSDARLISSTLSLWYAYAWSMGSNNALSIQPWRINNNKAWTENTYLGYNVSGQNHGVNFYYRDDGQTQAWTNGAAWYDATNDSNQTTKIKDTGGSVPGAIEPQHWVSWAVTNSVAQWRGGQQNNGFLLIGTSMEGSGYDLYGVFTARNDTIYNYRPKLAITYNAKPLAEADGGYEVWPNQSVVLDGSGSSDSDGTITAWNWDLDLDGEFDDASGVSPNISYAFLTQTLGLGPGQHTIKLRVTDSDGDYCTTPDTSTVTIMVPEPGVWAGVLGVGVLARRGRRGR